MEQLSQNLPGIVALALVAGICAVAGIRVGPRFLIGGIAGIICVLFGVTFITFTLGSFAPDPPFSSRVERSAQTRIPSTLWNTIMTTFMGVTCPGMCSTGTS